MEKYKSIFYLIPKTGASLPIYEKLLLQVVTILSILFLFCNFRLNAGTEHPRNSSNQQDYKNENLKYLVKNYWTRQNASEDKDKARVAFLEAIARWL